MSIFKKVVDEFVGMGGQEIDFNTTIGEPLLDPYLLERGRYVKQFPQFKTLGFVTNLQWLHKFNMDEFFAAGFTWLGISTTLSGPEKYLEFFGVDRYEQTLKNILWLFKENNKRKNKISLLLPVKPTDETVDAVINHPDFKMISSVAGYDLAEVVKNQSFFCDDWSGAVKLSPYLKKRPLYPRAFRLCRILYTSLIIFSNGNIGCCSCRDFEADSELILGNAREATLKEIWQGKKIYRIRNDWRKRNKIPAICKSCSHYLY
jgi:radical SAM protein with 4Fe4S-binding SPASM domain